MVSMALGASYAGKLAVTGSSDPGISLKSEALGWAINAEVPLIVCDIQRGGPSTGMPTNIEQSDLFIACFGMDMHVWRRFDSRLRLITARRNPNLLLLSASLLAGRPDLGILAVAWWTAVCFVIHGLRIAQAALVRRHGPLRSWLAAPA